MPDENKEITEDFLIKAIDFELENLNKEFAKPGWTTWAIYGALAGICWLIVSLFEEKTFNLYNIGQLYLFFHFISLGRGLFKFGTNETSDYKEDWLKFNTVSNYFDEETLIFGLIFALIHFFLALVVSDGVWVIQVIIVSIPLASIISLQIYQLWQLSVEFPRRLDFQKINLHSLIVSIIICLILFLIYLCGVLGYLYASISRGITSADIKIAGLFFGFAFLLQILIQKPAPDRVRNKLITLRRHVIFGSFDLNRAKLELKRIVGKLTPSEFVDQLYQDISLTLLLLNGGVKYSTDILNRNKRLLNEADLTDEIVLDQILNNMNDEQESHKPIERQIIALEKDIAILSKQIKRIKSSLYCDDGELDEIERRISEEFSSLNKENEKLRQLREEFFTLSKINILKSNYIAKYYKLFYSFLSSFFSFVLIFCFPRFRLRINDSSS